MRRNAYVYHYILLESFGNQHIQITVHGPYTHENKTLVYIFSCWFGIFIKQKLISFTNIMPFFLILIILVYFKNSIFVII